VALTVRVVNGVERYLSESDVEDITAIAKHVMES